MAFLLDINAGDHLISHTVARAVPSAQRGLTSVFEMGTGDPSQYGHRQTYDGAWRVVARSLPQHLVCPGWILPGRVGMRTAIWRQKICSIIELITTKLIGFTRLVRRASAELRGVNSMDKPNGRLVLVSFTHCCAFTPSLSTRWSFWALQGDLILERASRLYAFSGYHNRTSLPSRALGRTTGKQEVRPSRSSRTKDSPPQISYAHSR